MFRVPSRLSPQWTRALFALLIVLSSISSARAAQSVTLAWDPSQGSNIAGYTLYSGTTSGTYTQTTSAGLSTTGTLTNLAAGTTYYFVVTAYDTAGLESAPSNEVSFTTPPNLIPAVCLTSPTTGATLTAPASVVLTASASESGGAISRVDFYNGVTEIGEVTTSPYTFNWTNVAPGTYSLTAEAYDNAGASTVSNAVSVTVAAGAPTLSAMQRSADGCCTFTVAGVANRTYNVWVSSDLQNWTLLQTVCSPTPTFGIDDPTAAGQRSRFYKVSVQ
jgi:hypothetical protein